MRDTEQARQLMALASQDVDALEVMLESSKVSDSIFGFHAQQAVEKALKAWLAFLGETYPLTHSLNLLFALLEDKIGWEVDQFRELEALTPFAVQFRYSAYDSYEAEIDRGDTLSRVLDLVKHVASLVEKA